LAATVSLTVSGGVVSGPGAFTDSGTMSWTSGPRCPGGASVSGRALASTLSLGRSRSRSLIGRFRRSSEAKACTRPVESQVSLGDR
jgi:hypothetical protein